MGLAVIPFTIHYRDTTDHRGIYKFAAANENVARHWFAARFPGVAVERIANEWTDTDGTEPRVVRLTVLHRETRGRTRACVTAAIIGALIGFGGYTYAYPRLHTAMVQR